MTKIWKLDKADNTEQHFWTDTDGAHISSTGDHDTSGFHQLLTSVKNAFMHGTTELATFGEGLIELGKNSTSAVIEFCAGTGEIGVIDSMLTLFADKVGVKGNSQAVLASNGESNVAASKQNTTYAGLSQMAATAPSTDADPATALLQAKCTKNSDSSTVSETYISLEAKPDGKAPVTVKASDITLNSSNQNNKYTAIKTDGTYAVLCPLANGESVTMGAYDTSTGNPIDSGISFMPRYGATNLSTAYMNVSQIQTPMYLIPMTRVETTLQPVVLYNGGNALTYDTDPWYGTTGTVTLSEYVSHFKELVIFYAYDDASGEYKDSKTISRPNGSHVGLYFEYPDANKVRWLWIKARLISISGTSITNVRGGSWLLPNNQTSLPVNPDTNIEIRITRVEGIR